MTTEYIDQDEIAWHVSQHENWEMADEILAGMKARRGLKDRIKERALERREGELQRELVRRFAEQHGWKLSQTHFSLPCLARGGHHDGTDWQRGRNALDYHDEFDHPWFYRLNRRAVAEHFGLDVREITDFPSWWYPGWTKLVLWTGRVDRERQAAEYAAMAADHDDIEMPT